MMPAWVSSELRPIPRNCTVSVRFGSVLLFAAYSKWQAKWFSIEPGGRQSEIADPTVWWDKSAPDISEEEEHHLVFGQETTSARPLRGAKQGLFSFPSDDSGKLSTAAGGARRAG